MGHSARLSACVLIASLACAPAAADLVPAIEPVVPAHEEGLDPFVPISEELANALKSDGFLEPIVKAVQKPIPIWCDLAKKRTLEDGSVEYVAGPGQVFEASTAERRLPGGLRLPAAARFPIPPASPRSTSLLLVQDEMEMGSAAPAVDSEVCVECASVDFDAGELPMEKWEVLGDEFEVAEDEFVVLGDEFLALPLAAGLPVALPAGFPVALGGGGGGGTRIVPITPVLTTGGGGGGGGGGTPGGGGGGTPGTPGGGGPGITPPPAPIPLPQTGALILLGLGALGAAGRARRSA